MNEQAAAAMDAANKARISAAAYKRKIAGREIPLDTAIVDCNEVIRLEHLVKAYPQIGRAATIKLCRVAGVKETKYVKRGATATRAMPNAVCTKGELRRLQDAINECLANREKQRQKK